MRLLQPVAISIALVAAVAIVLAGWMLPAGPKQHRTTGSIRYSVQETPVTEANAPGAKASPAELDRALTQELETALADLEKPAAEIELDTAPVANAVPAKPPKAALAGQDPPMLYIHVRDEAQRDRAQRLVKPLRAKGIEVSGIKRVETGPRSADLRYFHSGELEEAWRIARALQDLKVSVAKIKRIGGYEEAAIPRQYELWLSPERNRPAGAAR